MTAPAYGVMSDLYNRLFAFQVSNPDVIVDYVIWNRIKSQLPKDYIIPDPDVKL